MNQSLTPSLGCALFAAGLFGWARSIDKGPFQNVLVAGGIILVVYSGFYALGYLLEHLPGLMYAAGDVAERLAHPEIALVTAFGKLSPEQLDAYMYQSGELLFHLDEKGSPDWSIEMNHRRLSSHWVSQFLYKCERYEPDFPPVSMHTDKSKANVDELAIRDFMRATKRIIPRPGMQDIWVDGHTPKTVRADYFEL